MRTIHLVGGRPRPAEIGLQLGLQRRSRLHNGQNNKGLLGLWGHDAPGLERHRLVAAGRLVGPVGDDEHAALAAAAAARTPSSTSSASAGSSPLVGSSSTRTGPGRQQGAGHGQPSAFAAGQGDAVLAHRRLEPVGECGHPGRQAGRPQRVGDLLVGGVGPAEDEVGPHRAGEELRPLVGQRAGGADVGLAQLARRRCRRATSVPASSGQKRRSAVTRLDLPAPLDPVTATRPPAGTRRLTPSRARGRPAS